MTATRSIRSTATSGSIDLNDFPAKGNSVIKIAIAPSGAIAFQLFDF